MNKPENIDVVLYKSLANVDAKLQKNLLREEIIKRWREIFDVFADKIIFVKLDGDALVVDSADNSMKDLLKYNAQTFVDKINEKIGRGDVLISKIKFGRRFDKIAPPRKISAPMKTPAAVEVELTAEEIAECEAKAAVITNPIQRRIVLDSYVIRAKNRKSRLQRGWHKCKFCEILCPPNEILCDVCRIKERERLHQKIRRIFHDEPWAPFREVQERIMQEFPHLKADCTLEAIEAARMSLILQAAARVSYGDTESDAAKFLVMLARQLPLDKLTPAIINRTLNEFRFNLADVPKLTPLEFSKLQNRLRKSKKPAAQTE